jgi:hypothetical protein
MQALILMKTIIKVRLLNCLNQPHLLNVALRSQLLILQ